MIKKLFLFTIFIFCLYNSAISQPSISIESFASGFNSPVSIKNAGDSRLFIVEQGGVIKILNVDGSVNTEPFLNIDNLVLSGGERGLLGLAFHPNYMNNGYFFVNYTNNSGNTVIARYSVNSSNPDIANPSSAFILMTISQPTSNHNGGDLAFGPDGFLYIPTGDGGGSGDSNNRAQNLNLLLGKLLRIDVDNGSPYGIPADNPFLNDGDPNTLQEIWAYGLRNPWRFSFDKQTGDIWIGDVGQGSYEEIDKASSSEAGLNYGWRCYEGNAVFNNSGCPDSSTLTFPVAVYSLAGSPCAISGGYRYRGAAYPNFTGIYFFADYCSNEIGTLEENGNSWNMNFTTPFSGNNWSSFGEDTNGELYIAGLSSGTIFKIIDSSTLSIDQLDNVYFTMYPNPVKSELNFDFQHSNSQITRISIYDVQGRLIKDVKQISINTKITTEELAKGLYLVEVLDENGNKTTNKLIIN
jgi:glucose/arabinose dehydrogenase